MLALKQKETSLIYSLQILHIFFGTTKIIPILKYFNIES